MNKRLRAALHAIHRGWKVFPLHSVDAGVCTCGNSECSSPGKHPLTQHGVKDATTDKSKIFGWWRRWANANVGIATGKDSGIAALDVDRRHGGFKSLRQLETEHGALPECPTVLTGGRGKHFYFRCPEAGLKTKKGLFPGIDLLADGAYAVGPESIHSSGHRYLWLRDKTPAKILLPSLPYWLLKPANGNRLSKSNTTLAIPEGRRHTTLLSLAGTMSARGMSAQAIEAALLEENCARCSPPLSDEEIRQIVASINRYAVRNEHFSPTPLENESSGDRRLPFRTATDFATETPADVPWIVKPWIAVGSITVVHGKPKDSGKTTYAMHLVAKVLEGEPFMQEPTCKTTVIYLSEERPTTLKQALRKADLLAETGLILLLSHEALGYSWPDLVHAAVDECKSRNAKLLVIDTFAQFAGLVHGEENSAGDVLTAIRPLQEAAAAGLAVVIVHHERKSGGLVSDSGRGSSAIAGAADIVISLRRPEGNNNRAVRVMHAISRFSETPTELQIELTENGYRALGAPGKVAREQAASDLLAMLPTGKKKAATIDAVMEQTNKPRPHVQKLLDALLGQGKLLRTGKGRKKDPFRYYAA